MAQHRDPVINLRRLRGFEIAIFDGVEHNFPSHDHDEFVISGNLLGREYIKLDRKTFEASANDITIYNPGQFQSGGAPHGQWSFVSLYLPAELTAALTGLPVETHFDRPMISSALLTSKIAEIVQGGVSRSANDDEVLDSVVDLLNAIVECAGARKVLQSAKPSKELQRVKDTLCDLMASPPPLQVLASEVGMTPVQLVRSFKASHGMPPFAWLANQRLKIARNRLSAGGKPADVAADLGFSDQAHLTRKFRAVFGVPPGAYKAMK
jgi:AraC family chemosensory pili system transcriptional regulator ChpD